MCALACGITFDYKAFEELVDLHTTQSQARESDFIHTLLWSLQKHNLELFNLVDIVIDGMPSITGCKNGTVALLYKHM
jgi:hypothetical protein